MSAFFVAELKRRNVIRMAGLYLVGAWLITHVAGTVLPMVDAPAWLPRSVVVLLTIGLVPALIFASAATLQIDPSWDPPRSDPRFLKLLSNSDCAAKATDTD